jgi:UDP-N-acetyl-2-amino-2-deoxyglucuronate dehydrogenase
MTDKLKTAVIGVGKVTGLHAEALSKLKISQFTAVCSSHKEKAELFARKYNIRGYTDVSEMVKTEKIEAAIICTPHPFHRAPAIAAMEAGAHVLVEKPLASSLGDCDAMLTASEKNKKQIGVICQRRWYKPVRNCQHAGMAR